MKGFLGLSFIILVTLAFLKPNIFYEWKQKILEFINPAVKEKRLLSDLDYQLGELSNFINRDFSLSEKERNKKINSVIENSKNLISEIKETSEKSDIMATVSNILGKVLPTNKEDLKTQPTWIPENIKCSANN